MQEFTDQVRWTASDDESALLAWIADRSTIGDDPLARHLAPVAAVGRLPDGRLAVDVLRPASTPLSAALDTLGVPTAGVAVTLSVPLLELVVAERSGAVLLGSAGTDDVLVDDAGAALLCDRPPGSDGARRSDHAGARALVLAVRLVWERTDPRDALRPAVDDVLAAAVDGDVTAARVALAHVRTVAPARPVRWDPPGDDLLVGVVGAPRVAQPTRSVVGVVRDLVEHGVPVGGGRRIPLRRAVVGVVVAAGCTAAAVFALG